MEIFLVGLIAGVVFIWIVKANKRNETLDAAGKNAKQCPHKEWVKADAIACRYCQRDAPESAPRASNQVYGVMRSERSPLAPCC